MSLKLEDLRLEYMNCYMCEPRRRLGRGEACNHLYVDLDGKVWKFTGLKWFQPGDHPSIRQVWPHPDRATNWPEPKPYQYIDGYEYSGGYGVPRANIVRSNLPFWACVLHGLRYTWDRLCAKWLLWYTR